MVSVVEKDFWPIFRAFLGPNLVQNLVFGSKLDIDSYNLFHIIHSDFIQCNWCYLRLTPKNGGILGVKNLILAYIYLKSVVPIQISLVF